MLSEKEKVKLDDCITKTPDKKKNKLKMDGEIPR